MCASESEYMYGIYVNSSQLLNCAGAPVGSFAPRLFLFFISEKKKRCGGAALASAKRGKNKRRLPGTRRIIWVQFKSKNTLRA